MDESLVPSSFSLSLLIHFSTRKRFLSSCLALAAKAQTKPPRSLTCDSFAGKTETFMIGDCSFTDSWDLPLADLTRSASSIYHQACLVSSSVRIFYRFAPVWLTESWTTWISNGFYRCPLSLMICQPTHCLCESSCGNCTQWAYELLTQWVCPWIRCLPLAQFWTSC